MNNNPTADEQYYVVPDKKTAFVDTLKEGAIIPGIETGAPERTETKRGFLGSI